MHFAQKLLLVAALAVTAAAQIQQNRQPSRQVGQTRTITLDDGQLLQIDSRTLKRLEGQGVDIGNLDNLSNEELERLGIRLQAVTLNIPGSVQRAGGIQEIRLRNGVILEIGQSTLKRLQNQGVDINTIPNLTEDELARLGLSVRSESITIQGAVQLDGGAQQITLRNGVIVVIDQATLQRLQSQGVDVNSIPNLSFDEARRLGINIRSETITIPGAIQLDNGAQEFVLDNGQVVTVTQTLLQRVQQQGVDINTLTRLTEAELRRLGLTPRVSNTRIPGATTLANGAQQIRLRNGVLLVINQGTLRRLQAQGVDISTLPDLSQAELTALGIQVTETVSSVQQPLTPVRIPGAVTLPGGAQQITLRNGVLLVIDQATLQRLQGQGVDIRTLPDLDQAELSRLGVRVTETVSSVPQPLGPVRIPGATTLPGGAQQIRLRNGVLLVIDQATLRRLQSQGVDISTLPDLSQAELQALGIQVTETVSSTRPTTIPVRIPGAITLSGGAQQITLRNGVVVVIDQITLRRLQGQGIEISSLPDLDEAELSRLGIQVTETVDTVPQPVGPIRIPGATTLSGGAQQIRLRNGALLVIDQVTLRRLQSQGVNTNTLPNLSQSELTALGIRVTGTGAQPLGPARIPGATTLAGGGQQIRLRNGVLLVIDQATLRRLQSEGVDINTLPNLSESELAALGIQVTETTVGGSQPVGPARIPGATTLAGGAQQIRLRNGVLLVIDQATLRRLQSEGVDINTLQNLSESELEALGIRVTETTFGGSQPVGPIRILGATTLPGGAQQIRLRSGVLVVIDQVTLRRIQSQGVNINTLQDLSSAELEALGIRVTESVTRVNADQPLRAGVTRRITVDGRVYVVTYAELIRLQDQGIDIDNLQALGREELIRLGVVPRLRPAEPRPRPQDEGSAGVGEEGGEPRPEPFNFAYTSETEDGASSSHQATQTADGVVTGSYTIKDANGQERRVDYVADANGYRATVTTNEIGTESQNTADAVYQSSAPTAAELSRQYTAEQATNYGTQTPVARRLVDQGQRRSPTPAVRREPNRQLLISSRLTAAPGSGSGIAPVAREPAASEEAGVQYTEDATEFETVQIA